MPTCREVAEQATDYLDGALPRPQRLGVWAHLRFCPNCRAFLRHLMRTVALTRSAGAAAAAEAPPAAPDEDRLVAMMKAARKPGGK